MTNHLNKIIALKNKKTVSLSHLSTVLSLKSISGGSPSVPVPYQLIENGNFESTDKWSGSNCAFSVNSNNIGVATVSTVSSSIRVTHEKFEMTKDHKYYYQIFVYAPKQIKFKISRDSTITITTQEISTINAWVLVEGIYTPTTTTTSTLRYYFDLDSVLVKTQKVYFSWAQLIDLTATFGAGNEPATVEEVKTLYPNNYYEYKPVE